MNNDTVFIQQPTLPLPAIQQQQNVSVNYYHRNWLVWSILNAIIFFPFWIIWLPALIFSIISRNKTVQCDYKSAKDHGNISFVLNIICTILGLISYIIIAIVIPLRVINYYKAYDFNKYYSSYNDCYTFTGISYYMCTNYHDGCYYTYGYDAYNQDYRFYYKC
jgi:hypothetical protein